MSTLRNDQPANAEVDHAAGELRRPLDRHDQPGPGFSRLFDIIRELLGTVISERYFSIALEEVKPSFHVGRLDSQRIDERSSLYVAVGADLEVQRARAAVEHEEHGREEPERG